MNLDSLTAEEKNILEIVRTVMDPEIAVNIVDLGLIYEIHYQEDRKRIYIVQTLSTRGCPLGDTIMQNVEVVVSEAYPGMDVDVELVWEPEWNPNMITEAGNKAING